MLCLEVQFCLKMMPHILLSQLKALLTRAPSFSSYKPDSYEHQSWLGQAHALVTQWQPKEAYSFKSCCDFLGFEAARNHHVAEILGTLHRAVADLELKLPASTQQSFGPGATYDFFKALNEVVNSAQKSLFIIDPFLDAKIFDSYLSSLQKSVKVRLLIREYAANVKPAAEKFIKQYEVVLETRKHAALHDRVIFIDDSVCWVLGQSIKDAAASKPTYFAPLSADIAMLKLADYEKVWSEATEI